MASLDEQLRRNDYTSYYSSEKRDVSPIGASRFERPYSPPAGRTSTTTNNTNNTSATTPDTPNHLSKPSVASTTVTYSTAPTSLNNYEREFDEISGPICALPEDRELWFVAKTAEEDSEDLPIEDADKCPDRATLAAVHDIPIYDAEGVARPFGSLYDPATSTNQRQLIIFIRHFYCGACQGYVRKLTEQISMQDYFSIPVPTSIILIGCGKPDMIPHYKNFTNCSFPIFSEPSRTLFKKLGMRWSMSVGPERPEYLKESILDVLKNEAHMLNESLKDPEGIRKRDLLRGGNMLQIGGEFLFEDGVAIWCHRMKHMRGHCEVDVLRRLLQLDE